MFLFHTILLAWFPAVLFSQVSSYDNYNNEAVRDAFRVIAASNLNFTQALYQVLSGQPGNLLISPLSIHAVLALTAQGAGGSTEREMIDGLSLPQDRRLTRDGFRQVLSGLTRTDGNTTKIATKIFSDKRYPPREEFSRVAQETFHSDYEKLDFTRGEQVRRHINQWVEANTNQKIREIVPEGSISRDTGMLLVNAVYFKGTWWAQFNPEYTRKKVFYVRPGVQPMIDMMQIRESQKFFFKESAELNAKILAIPYHGESVSFVIILPNERYGVHNVESRLVQMDLQKLFRQMHIPDVSLQMPKFKIQYSVELSNALSQMGMTKMFSNSANFSGLSSASALKISRVMHKTYIDVNEEGTEAAATSSITSVLLSAIPEEQEYVTFIVDHPFLYLLRHEKTGTILFMGRYVKPT